MASSIGQIELFTCDMIEWPIYKICFQILYIIYVYIYVCVCVCVCVCV